MEWIKTSDRLPEEGAWYMCWASLKGCGFQQEILFFDGENEHGIHWLMDGDFEGEVTHWMPLPSPPEEDK